MYQKLFKYDTILRILVSAIINYYSLLTVASNSNVLEKNETNDSCNNRNRSTHEIDSSSDEKLPILLEEEQFNVVVSSNNAPKWADDILHCTEPITSTDNMNNSNAKATSSSSNNTKSSALPIPEAADSIGFAKNVTLRSYQSQALHWMMKREKDSNAKEDVIRELELITDFASLSSSKQISLYHNHSNENDIPSQGIKREILYNLII